MNAEEEWDARLFVLSSKLLEQSGAAGAMVVLFEVPWIAEAPSAASGLAGTERLNPLRAAAILREMARVLEEQATRIDARESFEIEGTVSPGSKPV